MEVPVGILRGTGAFDVKIRANGGIRPTATGGNAQLPRRVST
jgi:hypothetical protein